MAPKGNFIHVLKRTPGVSPPPPNNFVLPKHTVVLYICRISILHVVEIETQASRCAVTTVDVDVDIETQCDLLTRSDRIFPF